MHIFQQASDGHFTYTPAFGSAFIRESIVGLVPMSEDGIKLPEIYDVADPETL